MLITDFILTLLVYDILKRKFIPSNLGKYAFISIGQLKFIIKPKINQSEANGEKQFLE